jgi:ABC-2 type transport system ATP-binding protein
MNAIETTGLSRRYGSLWALQECTFTLPAGKIAGLVGPNGAGKTTLIHMAVGLLAPSKGSIRVFGCDPQTQTTQVLDRIGFVAQNRPLYPSFTVQDMLTLGQKLNARWDADFARVRLESLKIPLQRRVARLSGGQQAQVALVLALAKRPGLLILDEPVGSLDPLARRDFLQLLMDSVAEMGQTVLFSSHQTADLDRICDYLVILSQGRVQVADDIEHLLASHKWLTCPSGQVDELSRAGSILQASHTNRASTFLVRTENPFVPSGWDVRDASLDDIILGYLAYPGQTLPLEKEILS